MAKNHFPRLRKENLIHECTLALTRVSKKETDLINNTLQVQEIQDGSGVSGSYTNLPQDQTGITTKLQKEHPE